MGRPINYSEILNALKMSDVTCATEVWYYELRVCGTCLFLLIINREIGEELCYCLTLQTEEGERKHLSYVCITV